MEKEVRDERTLCTASARNKRLLYSASSCGIWRSQHERLDDHGRFDERTLCTSSPRNKRLLYSASSCGIWCSQHDRLDDHGRFDERTLCTSSTRNKRLLYSASSCGIWRSLYGHFIFKAISNNCRSNTGVRVDHQHATNDSCIATRLAQSGAHRVDGLITMDGLMKEPSAQLQHATNNFCIAPRLAESSAHSMDTSFSRNFPIMKRYPEPHDHGGVYNRSPCAHQPHVRRGRRPLKPGESPAGACPLP